MGANWSGASRVGDTLAPDCDSCPGIYSATTSRHYSPSFGGGPPATAETANEILPTEAAIREGGGKASPSVSIFSRAPLCSNTCRHCRSKPCDIATDHDDHICYNCEQRILFPERIPKWEMQKLPICDLWCLECATQRCCTRGPHQHHLCMECERRGVVFLAPAGGEDPWAANDD